MRLFDRQHQQLKSKRPRRPGVKTNKLPAIIGLVGAVIVAGISILGLVAFAPGNEPGQQPGQAAAQDTATSTMPVDIPSATSNTPLPSTETATFGPSPTPAPTNTATITLIPTTTYTPPPLWTPDRVPRQVRVPILMYHYISVPPQDADIYRRDLSVTPDQFVQQMGWLERNGYQTITLYDLIYALNNGEPLPAKPVIITFDDGYADNYQNAFPILEAYDYNATFFILSDVTTREQPGYMTWDMLQEMYAAGMNIEVHGREHLDMTGRGWEWLLYHLRGPQEIIESQLGYTPRFLAYPSGRYEDQVIWAAHETGYWGAVTTQLGSQQDKETPYELKRLRVRGEMSLAAFAALITDY